MPISNEQLTSLLSMITTAEQDSLDCDGCFERLAEFADAKLANRELPEAMRAVEVHLRQCPCCKDEFNALLKGLRALGES